MFVNKLNLPYSSWFFCEEQDMLHIILKDVDSQVPTQRTPCSSSI